MTIQLLKELADGDLRSIGLVDQIVPLIQNDPSLIDILFKGLDDDNPVLKMRCADAIEKATQNNPNLLTPYKQELIYKFSNIKQSAVIWHIVVMLPRLDLSLKEVDYVIKLLLTYTNHHSSIVKTMSMQALADIAIKYSQYSIEIKQHIKELTIIGTPAMKSRGKKLLAAMVNE